MSGKDTIISSLVTDISITDIGGVQGRIRLDKRKNGRNTSSSNTINEKELWKHLHRKLELEISNLWQRSVFLATFIVLLFTGYGCFFAQVIIPDKPQQFADGSSLDFIGLFLACLIVIMGMLWIAMAKGSKYWYEIYEKKIEILEYTIMKGNLQFLYEQEYNVDLPQKTLVETGGLLSNKPSLYSPSKINIMLGWIVFVVGIFLMIFHSCRIVYFEENIIKVLIYHLNECLLCVLVVVVGLLLIVILVVHEFIRHEPKK